MNRSKEINDEYKSRKLCGGVYTITNSVNGKYLLGYAADLKSIQNRFQFTITSGSSVHPKLQKDWEEYGAQVFSLEVLEELEQKPDQSQAEFMEDLKILEQLCRANLDESNQY